MGTTLDFYFDEFGQISPKPESWFRYFLSTDGQKLWAVIGSFGRNSLIRYEVPDVNPFIGIFALRIYVNVPPEMRVGRSMAEKTLRLCILAATHWVSLHKLEQPLELFEFVEEVEPSVYGTFARHIPDGVVSQIIRIGKEVHTVPAYTIYQAISRGWVTASQFARVLKSVLPA